jgi:hypothetical protein
MGLAAGLMVPALALAATSIGTDITTTGKIGIGTTNPAASLEVIATSTFDTHLRLTNTNTGAAGPGLHFDAANLDWVLYASNPAASVGDQKFVIRDYSSALDRFIIDASGNVTVGTSTLTARFGVAGANPGTVTVLVKGAASQTVDLQQWMKADNSVAAKITNNGDLTAGNFNSTLSTASLLASPSSITLGAAATAFTLGSTSGTTTINNALSISGGAAILTPNATTLGLEVRGQASHTANLQEWHRGANTPQAVMSATGTLLLNGSLRVGAAGTQITRHISSTAASVATSSINGVVCGDYGAATVVGAAIGDTVTATPAPATNGIEDVSLSWNAYVSAPNVVTIRACNPTSGAINTDDNQSWRIDLWQH